MLRLAPAYINAGWTDCYVTVIYTHLSSLSDMVRDVRCHKTAYRGSFTRMLRRCVQVREVLWQLFPEEQIVKRAERSIFFNLVYGHFLTVYVQFNKATPAIKLVGTNFPDIFGTTIWTFHIHSPIH